MNVIKILIVDDSAFVRKVVRQILSRSPMIEIVGSARNGVDALEMVEELKPDVVTCDLNMPELDGIGFVRKQMARKPLPILILSVSSQDAALVMEALDAGAIDFVQKPSALANDTLYRIGEELLEKIKGAVGLAKKVSAPPPPGRAAVMPDRLSVPATVDVVVLGISTGGPQALRQLLPQLPADFPVPLVIVLHMPIGYTAAFAEALARVSSLAVQEAKDGYEVKPGEVLIAPAGQHLTFKRRLDGTVLTHLSFQPIDKPHKPSVDVLFESAAATYGSRVLGIVMTGMGNDGKEGASRIKDKGGMILTESEVSCIVYGMPRSVVEAGLSDGAVPLMEMADAIIKRI